MVRYSLRIIKNSGQKNLNYKTTDKWFSKYIRLRDSDDTGILNCISCGIPIHWTKADAGHFIKRQFKSTRYNEKNCNGQCRKCNWLLQGNDIEYAKGLVKKWGPGIVERLEIAKNRTLPMGRFELKHIADYYRMRFNQMKKLKGL